MTILNREGIILALLFTLVSAGAPLQIRQPSIVLLRGGFRLGPSKSPFPPVSYREASSLDPDVSQAVVNLGLGNWRLEPESAAYLVVPGRATISPMGSRDVLLRPYSVYLLDRVNVTIPQGEEAWLHISAAAEGVFLNASERVIYEVVLDGRVLQTLEGSGFRTVIHRRLVAGLHSLGVTARLIGRKGVGCVCPSAGNGFRLSHHLAAWWETVKHKKESHLELVNKIQPLGLGNTYDTSNIGERIGDGGLGGWFLDFAMSIL